MSNNGWEQSRGGETREEAIARRDRERLAESAFRLQERLDRQAKRLIDGGAYLGTGHLPPGVMSFIAAVEEAGEVST